MAKPAPLDARVHAIDAIRGFCLLNIFINHVTTGVLNDFSPSRIFFADSADAFVFLAGISSFLAYGPHKQSGSAAIRKPWNRAKTLFFANIVLVLISMLLLLGFSALAQPANPALYPGALMQEHGVTTYLWHVITMQQNVGYSVVLRLYIALMLMAPAFIWLAGIRYWLPLVPAAMIWVVAGHFDLAEHNSLTGVALSMTVLPWTLIFAAGVALGAGLSKKSPLPGGRPATWLAAAIVIAAPVCFTVATRISPEFLGWIDTRNDHFWTGASKSLQSPLRVASLFAMAYLVMALRHAPVVRLVHEVSPDNPLTQLGRRSLEVFAVGAVLALIVDHTLWVADYYAIASLRSLPAIGIELTLGAAAVAIMLRMSRNPAFGAAVIERKIASRLQRQAAPTDARLTKA